MRVHVPTCVASVLVLFVMCKGERYSVHQPAAHGQGRAPKHSKTAVVQETNHKTVRPKNVLFLSHNMTLWLAINRSATRGSPPSSQRRRLGTSHACHASDHTSTGPYNLRTHRIQQNTRSLRADRRASIHDIRIPNAHYPQKRERSSSIPAKHGEVTTTGRP
ncbi:hypothetical protein VTI28DRAFT_7549 [Corynascus sepedonium]